jgi:hypothetical protein
MFSLEKNHADRLFSMERMARFYALASQDEAEAMRLYVGNIQLSGSLYPTLTLAEVTLRNAVHRQLARHFGTTEWYLQLGQTPVLADLQPRIDKAQAYILERQETLSADKLVAELTFGFWVKLFNRAYENVLWKQLRYAFPHLLKADRQLATVSVVLNDVRRLRNRVYHNEPICWQLPQLQRQHQRLVQLIGWLAPQLQPLVQELDHFPEILRQEQARRGANRP